MAEVADRITVHPEQCGGRPCIRGLRIRVIDVLDLLAASLPAALELLAYENNYHQFEIGSVKRDALAGNAENLRRILGSPGGSHWWRRWAPETLTPAFRAAVDARVLGAEPRSVPA